MGKSKKKAAETVSSWSPIKLFHNENISDLHQNVMFWAWESILHHMYFWVLFVMRQGAKQKEEELWTLNMEKEAAFFAKLFTGDVKLLAQQAGALAAGMWWNNPVPTLDEKIWMGRLITNFQHTEGIIHTWIIVVGLIIVWRLSFCKCPEDVDTKVPQWLRWSFFLSLFLETWTMCVPYLIIFEWMWRPFTTENPCMDGMLAKTIEGFGDPTKAFSSGMMLGGLLMCFLAVSVIVLILDAWATHKAWQFIDIPNHSTVTIFVYGVPTIFFAIFAADFGRIAPPAEKIFSNFLLTSLHDFPYNHYFPWLK